MLIKCSECGNEVSSQAEACPKCGHPIAARQSVAQPPKATASRPASHAAGWISLAAFVFANFTPAILAPFLVLAGLIFAARELSAGSKVFGGAMVALCLLQGWFVLDHFGQISSSLGLVTAKDADQQAASRFANASLTLPSDWQDILRTKCREEWPTDYRMQQHCETKQTEAVSALSRNPPSDIDEQAFRVIRGKCSEEWPRDFNMREHCERKQYDAFRSLRSTSAGEPTRNACAQKWPNDYNMRKYCETRGR